MVASCTVRIVSYGTINQTLPRNARRGTGPWNRLSNELAGLSRNPNLVRPGHGNGYTSSPPGIKSQFQGKDLRDASGSLGSDGISQLRDAFIRKTGKSNSTEALPTSLASALCRITGHRS